MYMYIHTYIDIEMYIYMHIERESRREGETEREKERKRERERAREVHASHSSRRVAKNFTQFVCNKSILLLCIYCIQESSALPCIAAA